MSSPSRHSLHGLVLAGGRSSRMGTDKAALIHPDGRPLARRTCDLLNDAGCSSTALSLRFDQDLPPGFAPDTPVIRDPRGKSEGPLAGILAAFRSQPHADWLVLACDLPRLDSATLRHLILSHRPGIPFLAYKSESDGLPEPLCALYSANSIQTLETAFAAGKRCPRKVLIENHCRLLAPVTPGALDNANTPDDWKSATGQ